MIQVFQPTLGPAEQEAAAAVLASGWIGFGPKVLEFERAWAGHLGVPAENVVSVSCCTEALYQVFALIDSASTGYT
ncbi:DegT/DnrJ/EryC1/StrS family aminotransferase, partial [Klebsiella pneumoniae]|uniref:DegT/DnrJ/EryC1/StrS family aminotransferase n=1 Tax=Klebsiella pneumoniae TaxID=573 RepID=UPI001E4CE763